MEASLTPLARALRKFTAGRPAPANNRPIGAVALAVDQRERLENILASEGIGNAQITATVIVVRLDLEGADAPMDDWITVESGRESSAVKELEHYRDYGHEFTVSGLVFVVRAGNEERFVKYRIERTPEGDNALKLAEDNKLRRPKRWL